MVGRSLDGWSEADAVVLCGRVNGSDFIALAPRLGDARALGGQLRKRIAGVFDACEIDVLEGFAAACATYDHTDAPGDLLRRLDQTMALDDGDAEAPVPQAAAEGSADTSLREDANAWEQRLTRAIEAGTLTLEYYPVVTRERQLVHREGMLRLEQEGQVYSGGVILPWAHRLGLTGDVDRRVVGVALEACAAGEEPVCISLSLQALADAAFHTWLASALRNAGPAAARLHVEIEESAAFDHVAGFETLRLELHRVGAQLGIEHMGYRIADLSLIATLGADYLKVDSHFVRDIYGNTPRQALLTTYASIARQLGIPCIAEGVRNDRDRQAAIDCGVSGVSGPGVKNS